jgi:hypothetical protein
MSEIFVNVTEPQVNILNNTSAQIVVTPDNTPAQIVITSGPVGPAGSPGIAGPPGTQPIFSRTSVLDLTTGTSRYYSDYDVTIIRVRGAVHTPATGSDIHVEILLDQISVAMITIPTGLNTGFTDVSIPFLTGHYLSVNITQIGSISPGSDLTVSVTTH